jgi:uncharacterized membrane protein YhaH (DUF805 family)
MNTDSGIGKDEQGAAQRTGEEAREMEEEYIKLEGQDCRKPFLHLFILLTCVGSILLALAQVVVENNSSFSTIALLLVATAAGILYFVSICLRPSQSSSSSSSSSTSTRQQGHYQDRELMVGLYVFCCVIDVMLTMSVLTDSRPRDLFAWYLCIPLLFLYARGVRACVVALVFVCAQTTVLRYLRAQPWGDLTALSSPTTVRHTTWGAFPCQSHTSTPSHACAERVVCVVCVSCVCCVCVVPQVSRTATVGCLCCSPLWRRVTITRTRKPWTA